MLQSNATTLPLKIVTGTNCLWLDVPITNLAICGTANPIKDTGPQKAVADAVNTPVTKSMTILVGFIRTPRFSA